MAFGEKKDGVLQPHLINQVQTFVVVFFFLNTLGKRFEMMHACENFRVDHWGEGGGGGGQWGRCGGVDRVRRDVERGFKLLPTVWFLS